MLQSVADFAHQVSPNRYPGRPRRGSSSMLDTTERPSADFVPSPRGSIQVGRDSLGVGGALDPVRTQLVSRGATNGESPRRSGTQAFARLALFESSWFHVKR
jgi:hypothetical protein